MKLLMICVLLTGFVECEAEQIVSCTFSENEKLHYHEINVTYYYYTCFLDTSRLSYGEKPTAILGQHVTGKSNDYVQYLINYRDHMMQTFSSIYCLTFRNLEAIQIRLQLEYIDEDSLYNCRYLKHLIIEHTELITIPGNLLIANPNLERILIIRNSFLSYIPQNLFIRQNKLIDLILHKNQLTALHSGIFHPLTMLQVQLDISGNNLLFIDPKWFETIVKLEVLDIEDNKITQVPPKCFRKLQNLKRLWLGPNEIETLHPDSFEGLSKLEKLVLRENKISNLPLAIFSPLIRLEILDIGKNKLLTVHSDSFSSHRYLTTINFDENIINEFDEKIIAKTAVSFLNMLNNSCINSSPRTRSQIVQHLTICFRNYRPRSVTTNVQQNQNEIGTCGRPMLGQGAIYGGTHISRGAFPWIAVLQLTNGQYFCGGVLITNRKVVTAAHCLGEKGTSNDLSIDEFAVLLGVHDLSKNAEGGRFVYGIESITKHPDWSKTITAYDADIAVLVLDQNVQFGKFIQPVCLIPPGSPIFNINEGVAVGFGQSEDPTKLYENIAKVLMLPIHKNEECFLKNKELVTISSKRTVCIGPGTGVGVCKGDSGGGVYVNANGIYYLRGIISSSLFIGINCDLSTYSAATNLFFYYDWIQQVSGNPYLYNGK